MGASSVCVCQQTMHEYIAELIKPYVSARLCGAFSSEFAIIYRMHCDAIPCNNERKNMRTGVRWRFQLRTNALPRSLPCRLIYEFTIVERVADFRPPASVRASNDTQRSKANALAPSLRDCSRCALSASIPAVRELISTRRWFHIVTGGWSPWVICERYREKNCAQLRCAGAWVRGRPERPHVARVRKNYLFAERQQSYASEARGAGRALGSGSRKCP